jgi:SAM-dependent methyltransferase
VVNALERYLEHVRLRELFDRLGAEDAEVLAENVQHFTVKEAEKRDQIALGYFGSNGVDRIVNRVVELLLAPPTLESDATALDVGAGSGFFTARIAEKVRAKLPWASFFAMDLTPAMLQSLAKKKTDIAAFIGLAENIAGSLAEARKHFAVPERFDAVFSTLMLHHSGQPEKVFESIGHVLNRGGRAVIVDMCRHGFGEFRTEMGDVHLGFEPEAVRKMAEAHFTAVSVEKLPGIRCESSGRVAEIFAASMRKGS